MLIPINFGKKSAYCIILIYCIFDTKTLNKLIIMCKVILWSTVLLWSFRIFCRIFPYLITEGEALFVYAWQPWLKTRYITQSITPARWYSIPSYLVWLNKFKTGEMYSEHTDSQTYTEINLYIYIYELSFTVYVMSG